MMPPGPAGGWDTFIIIGDAGYHMADINFCTRCGENVSPEALYCPACGAPIEGRVAADGRTAEQVIEDRLAESRISWILMLLIIYAIPAIVAGLYLIIEKDAVASIMMADQSFSEFMTQYGMSEAQLRTYVGYIGILALVSGLSAAASGFCVYKRTYWIIAVTACAVASFLCIGSIFGFLIGLMVTWMIITSKPLFKDRQPASQ